MRTEDVLTMDDLRLMVDLVSIDQSETEQQAGYYRQRAPLMAAEMDARAQKLSEVKSRIYGQMDALNRGGAENGS